MRESRGCNAKEVCMKSGEKLVIVGCSGSGGPAAMLAKKLMPEVDITVIRKEEFFIVR
jgi:D-arabinose 1-dehydrogenase-like Zn-dependent alcohol dehydrogenase